MKTYQVTITPKHKAYAGSWKSGSYTVEIHAATSAEAVKRARRDYNDENGRENTATYKAAVAH